MKGKEKQIIERSRSRNIVRQEQEYKLQRREEKLIERKLPTAVKRLLSRGNVAREKRQSINVRQSPIPIVVEQQRGILNNPPVNPYKAPNENEGTTSSMDGIYRPFTIGENGTNLNKQTIFDLDEDSRKRRRNLWIK